MHETEMLDYICKIVPDREIIATRIYNYLPILPNLYIDYIQSANQKITINSFEEYIYYYVSSTTGLIKGLYDYVVEKEKFVTPPSRFNTLIHAYNLSPEHLLWLIGVCNKYEAYEQVAILEQRIAEIGGCKPIIDRFQI